MSSSALRDGLPTLAAGGSPEGWPEIGRGGASFSDDLVLADGSRLAVRVRITDREGGGYVIDLRDCDGRDGSGRFGLSAARAETACLLALGHALGIEAGEGWRDGVELLVDEGSWIGAPEPDDAAAIAFGLARTFDAVLGAFGYVWPRRVGAGSCSLGAIVRLSDGEDVLLTEVLPGGEGGRPDRAGRDAWAGPVLPTAWPEAPTLDGVRIEGALRQGSGGGGKHPGGEGVIRRYLVERPLVARIAFDRVSNPPHGVDRAGPPEGTAVTLRLPKVDETIRVQPFERVELPAGSQLEVRTCGGAGWGFPGYGDIEWDPGDWFGSKPKSK